MSYSTITFAVMLLAAVLAVPDGSRPVFANGSARPVVKDQRVGPYELQVGILPGRPVVGNLHLSILVKDAHAGAAVTNATVTVSATGPEGTARADPVRATNTPQSPQFYDADIPLGSEGSWIITLEMDSHLGAASLDVPMLVTEPEGLDLVFLLAGAVAVLAIGFWAWDRISGRRKRPGTQA